jgi:hypothetical protein
MGRVGRRRDTDLGDRLADADRTTAGFSSHHSCARGAE